MATRTVTGTLKHPVTGNAWASASVVFRLPSLFIQSAATIPPEQTTVTTDSNGAFSTALAVPDSGTAVYEVTTPDGKKYWFNLASGSAVTLETLLSAASSTEDPDELQLIVDTHAASADPHSGYQKESEKSQASGYASLDSAGTIPDAEIPATIARDSEVDPAGVSTLPMRHYASIHQVATTITAAIAAAVALNPSGQTYEYHPANRRLVLIPAGTYAEEVELKLGVDLIGETGDPDDVVISSVSQASPTLLAAGGGTTGENCLIANLTAVHTTNGAETAQYALHLDHQNEFGQPALFVAHNCKFQTVGTSVAGNAAIGVGVWDRQAFYFKDCEFYSTVARAVYAHNGNSGYKRALLVFDSCISESTVSYGVELEDIATVATQDDLFIWSGGSITGTTDVKTTGTATHSLTFLLDAAAYTTSSHQYATQAFDTPIGYNPPQPANNPDYEGYYIGTGTEKFIVAPVIPDAAPSTVTALRYYYWPVHLEKARFINRIIASITATAGNVCAAIYADSRTGLPDATVAYLTLVASTACADGRKALTCNWVRPFFPGKYWLAVAFDSATVEPVCSTYAPLVQQMYYEDLGILVPPAYPTPVALTAGPVPIVSLEVV